MSSESRDLLSKADALMARQHPGRASGAPLAEIPVLDEVVGSLPEDEDLPLLTEYVVPVPLDEEQTQALAASIRAGVLAELQPRIDALIEQRLNDDLAPLFERMADELRGNLRLIAHEILEDAVHSAVEQELERRK